MRLDITGVILAGGLGRRMGGLDKGLLMFRSRPLVEHVLDFLNPQVAAVLINANRNLERYARYGVPVIRDEMAGYCGPLVGLLAGMRAATTELILSIPCDCPRPPPDLVRRLYVALKRSHRPAAVARDRERVQPLFTLLHRDLAPGLRAYLQDGGRKAETWMARQEHATVDFSDRSHAFANINTPEALSALARVSPWAGTGTETGERTGT
jgi:molybdenum cofactor guanylyltransferase